MTDIPAWKPMRTHHLPEVADIAAAVHPAYPEDEAIFAERLRLSPHTCFVLCGADNRSVGYALAHWWRLGDAPRLNSLIGALPSQPDTLYIHDVAILPAGRGCGAARALLGLLDEQARIRHVRAMSLVAVNASAPFWARLGFVAAHDGLPAAKLATYGADAFYMVRRS